MPKTRHEKFCQSFDKYMLHLKINNMDYNLSYTLRNTTDNQTKSIHSYTLDILGNRESIENTGENIITLLPTTTDFINNMKDYFDPYAYIIYNRRRLSYINIITENTNDYVSTIDFQITYFSNHLPFPVPLTLHETLLNDIDNLQTELHEQGRQLTRMRRKYYIEKERLRKVQIKVQSRMERIYNEQEELQDCPVCLEEIQKNNLYVPLCFHYICRDCFKRCEKCPLCRENYVLVVQ